MRRFHPALHLMISLFVLTLFGVFFFFIGPSIHTHADTLNQSVTILPAPAQNESGEIDYGALSLDPVLVEPSSAQAGALSMYRVEFPVDRAVPVGGSIAVLFSGNFTFAGSCPTPAASPLNNDLNGSYPGVVTIASIVCDSTAHTVTLTTAGSDLARSTKATFLIQGVINDSEAREVGSSPGFFTGIRTYTPEAALIEEKTAAPFFLESVGSLQIAGTVFLDNGVGGGVAKDGLRNGTEMGLGDIQVCLNSSNGRQCDVTSSNGGYTFNLLKPGPYRLELPPLSSNLYLITQAFKDVELRTGQNLNVNLPLRSVERTITVGVAGIPDETDVSVYAVDPLSGSVSRKTISWDGTNVRQVNMPVQEGSWEVGVEPVGAKKLANFIAPAAQSIRVAGAGSYVVNLVITPLERRIYGIVTDTTGAPIANAVVVARPSNVSGDAKESTTESKKDGTFEVAVNKGAYSLSVSKTGMNPIGTVEVTVTSNGPTEDGNATADVYRSGVLLLNNGGTPEDDLILKLIKGRRSISGKVLNERGGIITNAFVEASSVTSDGEYLGKTISAPTDATGTYSLFVEDGRWRLKAFAPGYGEISTVYVTVAGLDVSNRQLQVSADAFGTVSGTVKKNGIGVSGAFVTVFNSAGSNRTVTDEEGNYSLNVRSGNGYTIQSFLPGLGAMPPLRDVTVVGGQTRSGQDFVIDEPGVIRVTIAGVTDAFVQATNNTGNENGTGSNPTPGVYEIQVPAGSYDVRANSLKFGFVGLQAGVNVEAGGMSFVTFRVNPTFTISGSVTSGTPFCVSAASILITDVMTDRTMFLQTDDLGAYSTLVPNGKYRISASKPGCLSDNGGNRVVVNDADVLTGTTLPLSLADTSIYGRVTLNGINVGFETKVIAKNANGDAVSTDADLSSVSTSNYTLPIRAGTWSVFAITDGYESSVPVSITVSPGTKNQVHIQLEPIPGYVVKEPTSTLISPAQGGMVKDANLGDGFELNIPAGALGGDGESGSVKTKETTAIVAETKVAVVVGGSAVSIRLVNADGEPIKSLAAGGVTVKVPYSPEDVLATGMNEANLALATWSDEAQEWIPLSTTVNTEDNSLTALVTHFSLFAPIVPVPVVAPEERHDNDMVGSFGGAVQDLIEKLVVKDPEPLKPQQPSDEPVLAEEPTEPSDEHPIISEPLEVLPVDVEPPAGARPMEPNNRAQPAARPMAQPVARPAVEPSSSDASRASDQRESVDLAFTILNETRTVTAGEALKIFGAIRYQGPHDYLTLHYQMLNANGQVVFDELELVTVNEVVKFQKAFRISEFLPSGPYTFFVKSLQNDQLIEAYDFFQVQGTSALVKQGTGKRVLVDRAQTSLLPLGVPIAIVLTLVVAAEFTWVWRKKKIKRSKKKS